MFGIRRLLAKRPDDAAAFDGTLRDPAAVNRWLASHGAGPLSAAVSASADRPRQVYEIRPDLRAVFPHALLPPGRQAYFDWLLTHGRSEYGLANDEIVAFLVELDRDPSFGLADTFRLTPRWQEAVPHGLTTAGWPTLIRWVREFEGSDGP